MSEIDQLPKWLDIDATILAGEINTAETLANMLPGLEKARLLTPMQRLQRIQESGLAECGGSGGPVHLAWRHFLRGNGPSILVIDATSLDERARGSAKILETAAKLVAEGVIIATGLRNSMKVELHLPEELTGHEAVFLNTVDDIRSLANIAIPRRQIEIIYNRKPDCWSERPSIDNTRLIHTPETWCRIALLFAGESNLDTLLLTLRRGMKQRGLVELRRSGNLKKQIETWGGGIEVEGQDAVLVFDDGMSGFLPLSKSDILCDPLSFMSAGINPTPSTLMVMADGVCVVKQTRRALYRHWLLAEGKEQAVRSLLARAARLTTSITLGTGNPEDLIALDEIALKLIAQGLAAAGSLVSSLRHFRDQWESHVRRESCPEDICLERKVAPCHSTCPANIDIPSFIAHLGHGDYRSTIEVIRRDNPLPLVCGLVCPAPCESACVRGSGNGAVFIRPLKAKAAEHCLSDGGYPKPEIAPDSGKKIGIIGSGPSGLTAAFYLRTMGHDVTIFEAQEHAGGMLRYGIPAYRMPPDLLEQEIDQIRVLGVKIHTNSPINSLEEFRKDYDAVFMGLGTQRSRLIPIEGVHQPFVLGGIDFLRAVRSGKSVRVGPRVVVIGGGNVSIDVALTALRQGAQHVDLTSLEKRNEMPASPNEIELAVAEGVQIHAGWGPVNIDDDGEVIYQFCESVKDVTGKFNPKFNAARQLKLEADHVILATGQGTDISVLEGSSVENNRGFVVTDSKSLMTGVPGVFAGGDAEHGPRTAVEAIRSGKIAASSIDAWLKNVPMDKSVGNPIRHAEVPPLQTSAADRSLLRRTLMPERSAEEVLGEGNYVRIEEGLTDKMAHNEAKRCLRCDSCIGCGQCMAACSEMGVEALRMADTKAGRLAYFDFTRPGELCIGCGACTQVCPTGAIRIEDADGVRRTIITGTVVREQPLLVCSECGAPTLTPAHREFIQNRLPDHMSALLDRELCESCARLRADRPVKI